jgi:F0F1-type ATP synthase membrane subunit b/b'
MERLQREIEDSLEDLKQRNDEIAALRGELEKERAEAEAVIA